MSPAELSLRGRGRPRGSRDMHGRARRFDPMQDRAYRDAIARRVRAARLEQDISPTELAAAVGLSPSNICRIERGEARPLAQTLCRIAVALGLSPSELMP